MAMSMHDATQKAVKAAGGSRAVGKALNLTRQAVEDWPRVPAKHVLRLEQLSGVSRYELRPDIYGEAPPRPLRRRQSDRVVAA